MDDKTADTLRCFAHEVIIKLMDADREMALVLLRDHATSALERVRSRPPTPQQLRESDGKAGIEDDIGVAPPHFYT